jgi:hypothetical protein
VRVVEEGIADEDPSGHATSHGAATVPRDGDSSAGRCGRREHDGKPSATSDHVLLLMHTRAATAGKVKYEKKPQHTDR